MFAERGYDGVSNREIVAACGLTKGAIYWYFESKEDLFRTVVAEAMGGFQDRLALAIEDAPDWEARLRAAFLVFTEVLEAEDDPHRDLLVLLVSRFPRGPGTDGLVSAGYEQLLLAVEAMLSGRPGGGPISDRHAASLVHAAGLGVLVLEANHRSAARPTLNALLRLLGSTGMDQAHAR